MLRKHNKTNPEIIAVLCVYNEELNLEGCLSHLEQFVDKIIILDDCSTDNTLPIAKRHTKVTKILKNRHKSYWNERQNRQRVLEKAYQLSNSKYTWALCVDADERFEMSFLQNLRSLAQKYKDYDNSFTLHFCELWNDPFHYRVDGIWGEKRKAIFFKLQPKMTFKYQQEHHIPWYYQELQGKEYPLNYNIYHLKMIKDVDRKKRVKLYNELDPTKKMQPIGYDYLIDTNHIKLKKIPDSKAYNNSSIPDYYL